MQEHFNEEYMESDKYPYSTFNGKLNGNGDITKEGIYKGTATGKFNIHGVDKEKTVEGKITVKKTEIDFYAQFYVLLKDYKITVPSAVGQNIADSLLVTVNMTYEQYKKK